MSDTLGPGRWLTLGCEQNVKSGASECCPYPLNLGKSVLVTECSGWYQYAWVKVPCLGLRIYTIRTLINPAALPPKENSKHLQMDLQRLLDHTVAEQEIDL